MKRLICLLRGHRFERFSNYNTDDSWIACARCGAERGPGSEGE